MASYISKGMWQSVEPCRVTLKQWVDCGEAGERHRHPAVYQTAAYDLIGFDAEIIANTKGLVQSDW
jgi:hypothetical protein